MNKSSRTSNSIKNVGICSALQVFALLLSFITRSVFLKLLGIEYLSVDGVFGSILTLLNFTELGIGAAITFSLYKPIANHDYDKIGALMNLFRTAYRYIAIVISVLGVLIIPLLPYIIKDVPVVQENLSLLYCLFLSNTVCTYVYGYKRTLLVADQKNYIVQIIYQTIHTIQILAQIAILFLTHNYILYLCVLIGCTLLNNIVCTLFVNKKYVWLNKYIKNKLSSEDSKVIFDNIKSIAMYKLGAVVLNGTNSIVISTFIKTIIVGFCSNYLLVTNSITAIINQGLSGLMASIGNFNVNAKPEDNQSIFKQLDLLMFALMGFVCLSLYFLINDFICLWLGEQFLLNDAAVFLIVLSFYVFSINNIPYSFRTAMGLFQKAKYYPFIAAIINLVLSVIFAIWIGLEGVFIANIIARFLCYTLVDASLIYHIGFQKKVSEYFVTYCLRLLFLVVAYLLCYVFFKMPIFTFNYGIGVFCLKIIIIFVVYLSLFIACYHRNESFRAILKRFCILSNK